METVRTGSEDEFVVGSPPEEMSPIMKASLEEDPFAAPSLEDPVDEEEVSESVGTAEPNPLIVQFQSAFEADDDSRLAEAMLALTKGGLKWGHPAIPKGLKRMEQKKPFYVWLFMDGPAPKVMNCWESVLLAAHNAGLCDKSAIRALITNKKMSPIDLVMKIKDSASGKAVGNEQSLYEIPSKTIIKKGHVVVFGDEGQHVALSLGKVDSNGEHEILELDKYTDGVSPATIEGTARRNSAYGKVVYWGPLPV